MHKISKTKQKELSEEKVAQLKSDAAELMNDCVRQMLYKQPFIGSIAVTLDLIPIRDVRCTTAATDGKSIYFDIDFLSSLSKDECCAVIAHEVWHNVMMHFIRTGTRDRMLFNIATDLEVNQILKEDGFTLPDIVLMPDAKHNPLKVDIPKGLSAEEYYELLLKKLPSNKQNGNSQNGSNSQSGSSSKNGSQGSSSSDGSDGSNSSDENGGSGKQQFDKHIYEGDEYEDENGKNSGSGNGQMCDKYGPIGFDKDFHPKMTSGNAERVRQAAVGAAQKILRERGELPSHISRIVNELTTPEVKWQEVLQQFICKTSGDKRTWSRPNRRFVGQKLYLPASYGEKIKIAIGIDTSGSTAGDIPKFLGEINGLVKSFGDYELTIIECDAKVGNVSQYSQDNPLDLENTKFEITGGGGTAMKPIFDYIALNDVDCDAIVILTDGYIDEIRPEEYPEQPVLWMVSKEGTLDSIKAGEKFQFTE